MVGTNASSSAVRHKRHQTLYPLTVVYNYCGVGVGESNDPIRKDERGGDGCMKLQGSTRCYIVYDLKHGSALVDTTKAIVIPEN